MVEVSEVEHLEKKVDNWLQFENLVEYVCGNLAQFIGLLFRGTVFFAQYVLVNLYRCCAKAIISFALL